MNLNELQDFTKKMVNYQRFYKKEDSLEGMKYYVGLFNELAARVLSADNEKKEEKTPGTVTLAFSKKEINPDVVTAFKDLGNSFQLITETVKKPKKKASSRKTGNPYKVRPWREERDQKIIELYNECERNGQELTDDIVFRIAQIVGSTSPRVIKTINEYTFSKI